MIRAVFEPVLYIRPYSTYISSFKCESHVEDSTVIPILQRELRHRQWHILPKVTQLMSSRGWM